MDNLVRPVDRQERVAAQGVGGVAAALASPQKKASDKKNAGHQADKLVYDFLQRLGEIKVLDPACGSGNFLYVTLQKLKDLEKEVIDYGLSRNLGGHFPVVGPGQLYGIEVSEYAHDLAQMTVWIGYLQWMHDHAYSLRNEPILGPADNFKCMDAIIDLSDPANPKEPEWPEVDFIVGNPPFLGTKKLRSALGNEYVDRLFALYADRIPNFSDLCCYWFEKARQQIEDGKSGRAGLLATQGIRGGLSREVLKRVATTGRIFFAESDRDWVLDGASVHVSLVGFDDGSETNLVLNGRPVPAINPDLTCSADVTLARVLTQTTKIAFYSDVKAGTFDISSDSAARLLLQPNPNGLPNSDVLVPWINGRDVLQGPRHYWIVDFGTDTPMEDAARYESPFEHVRRVVLPQRSGVNRARYRDYWWLHAEPCAEMRERVKSLHRFLVTPIVSKYRVFSWLTSPTLPDHAVVVFARSDDCFFGVLHSRLHEVWARAQGTQLRERESGFRYTPTTCFETFPFPEPTAEQEAAIAEAARELNELREHWLNPPEWTREEILEFPGSADGP